MSQDLKFDSVSSLIKDKKLITIEASNNLEVALSLMIDNDVRHLPVVTKHTGELVGIISERDVRLAANS
jgi:CBS domain-containing protein